MITHLELNILECKVKWALGSITTNKASGGDGILVKRYQILKDDAVKVLNSICQHMLSSGHRTGKVQFSFQSQRKAMSKFFDNLTKAMSKYYSSSSSSSSLAAKSCLTLVTPWTVTFQVPLPMGFSRQEYWRGLQFPSPGDLPDPGIEPRSPTL